MKHCFYFYFLNIYLFTCLGWVLVAAHEILRCGLWDPVSWPGTEHGPPALGARRLSHQITTKCRYVIYLISTDLHLTIAFTRGCSLLLCLTHFLSGFISFYMFILRFLRCNIQFTQFSNFHSVALSAHGLGSSCLWRLSLTSDWQLAGTGSGPESPVPALCYPRSATLLPPRLLPRTVLLPDLFPHAHWCPDNREGWPSSTHPFTVDPSLERNYGSFVHSTEVRSDTHLVWSFYLKINFFLQF